MKRSEVKVDIYFDSPDDKRKLRSEAGKANMSMTAFAKAILRRAINDPLFLASVSDITDDCTDSSVSPAA